MVKDSEVLIKSCEYFLKYNTVFVGYQNEHMKMLGKRKQIFVNGLKIDKNQLGSLIFSFVEPRFQFIKKWSTLTNDLSEQILSMV